MSGFEKESFGLIGRRNEKCNRCLDIFAQELNSCLVCWVLFSLFLCTGLVSQVGVANDRLADRWIDSCLNTDVGSSASDWMAEFTNTHHRQPPNQVIPVEHHWARDFLGRHEHDVW